MTHYDVLEITRSASAEVIRGAYRSLAAKYHPDRDQTGSATKLFKRIQAAYEVLSSPERKAAYDRTIDQEQHSSQSTGDAQRVLDIVVKRTSGQSTFLTLREHIHRKGKELHSADLSGLDLSGINFSGANLVGAKLDRSICTGCDFTDADMVETLLLNCRFENARFNGANLTNAVFTGSSLTNAAFFRIEAIKSSTERTTAWRFCGSDATMRIVDTSGATRPTFLKNVNFQSCNLMGAKLSAPANIARTVLRERSVFGFRQSYPLYIRQTFSDATITGCQFDGCCLRDVVLTGFDLRSCTFSNSNLSGADLRNADLRGVNLSSANLIDANLHKVRHSDQTKVPTGYAIPSDSRFETVETPKETALPHAKPTAIKDVPAQPTGMTVSDPLVSRDPLVVGFALSTVVFVGVTVAVSLTPATHYDSPKHVASVDQDPLSTVDRNQRTDEDRMQTEVDQPNQTRVTTPVTPHEPSVRGHGDRSGSAMAVHPSSKAPFRYAPLPDWREQNRSTPPTQQDSGSAIALSWRRKAIEAAERGDYDAAIEFAHKARETASFNVRVELAKQIRQWDKLRKQKGNAGE